MGCEMGKIKVVMNKPVYLGQAILDLSRLIMYEFHYDYIEPKYRENLKLLHGHGFPHLSYKNRGFLR